MNSLQIYEIPELNDIITEYQKQFEYIDQLEHELSYGCIDIEFAYNLDKVRFEVDIRYNINNVYINGEIKCKNWDFIDIFSEQEEYAKEAIYQFVAKKIINRYTILPFDKPRYYEDVDALLYIIFKEGIESIFDTVEKTLIDEFFNCQLRHQELDGDVVIYEESDNIYCNYNKKNFLDELLIYLDNEEPFIIRDNVNKIVNFFDDIKYLNDL